MNYFDFIIIGAGSAGCVLADKLSSSGSQSVLLIEAGPSDKRFWIQAPIGYGILFTDPKVNWCYFSETEPNLKDRKIYFPRGKVLGGSSSINALVYHRGQSSDYNDWDPKGNNGWNYRSLEKIFDSFENVVDANGENKGNSLKCNYLNVSNVKEDYHELKNDFIETCIQSQIPTSQLGCLKGEGVGPYFITTKNGKRFSSAKAFLKPSINRPNLKVIKNSQVSRILFKDGCAIGVECKRDNLFRDQSHLIFMAKKEVILSAGAINSPQILQLSGVGQKELLKKFSIDLVLEQKNVGKNLQDHLGINYYFKANRPTLNNIFGNWQGRIRSGIQYIFTKKGPLSIGVNQIGGLVRSSSLENSSNIQLYFNPVSYQTRFENKRYLMKPDNFPGFFIGFNSCRPESRGSIEIQSNDINCQPKIFCNYLSNQKDIDDVVKGARLIGLMQETQAIKNIISHEPNTLINQMNDYEIIDDFRQRSSTVFHPCGTCKMGSNIENSVVDYKLKVHGLKNLRIVDASIFPNITSANTNSPTIMVAHKAAEMINEEYENHL